MKVIRNDSDMLILRDWSWGVIVALAVPLSVCAMMAWGYFHVGETKGGLILSGIGAMLLFPLYSFARLTAVRLDRIAGTVRVIEAGLFLFRLRRYPLRGLSGATMETYTIKPNPADHAGERNWRKLNPPVKTWRPVLTYADGTRVPLLQAYGEQMRAGMAASAVNAWVHAPAGRK
jgi:hypothetical protein